MHDLQKSVYNEHDYIRNLALSAINGGIWGDFIAKRWISDYLRKPIYVWSNDNLRIMTTSGEDFGSALLNLEFGSAQNPLMFGLMIISGS